MTVHVKHRKLLQLWSPLHAALPPPPPFHTQKPPLAPAQDGAQDVHAAPQCCAPEDLEQLLRGGLVAGRRAARQAAQPAVAAVAARAADSAAPAFIIHLFIAAAAAAVYWPMAAAACAACCGKSSRRGQLAQSSGCHYKLVCHLEGHGRDARTGGVLCWAEQLSSAVGAWASPAANLRDRQAQHD